MKASGRKGENQLKQVKNYYILLDFQGEPWKRFFSLKKEKSTRKEWINWLYYPVL